MIIQEYLFIVQLWYNTNYDMLYVEFFSPIIYIYLPPFIKIFPIRK